ncbi:hypothetical protein DID88_004384 [Monilinia fructigena]|uniref:Uncharacterized protein n=1 Tax=Monilinia fructigena TaxID=38457 RepID=A0A395IUH1_9HELO|nr:hypothetical protein DID88_004384 [Monilinia fructigena]
MTNGGLNAQIVGGHMADRKKMLRDQPRAIRNEKDDLERLRAVSDIRCRPWVGDKMLLMQANNTTHAKVKNHFEERARQEAKRAMKAGGQGLLDFEELRDKRDTSSRYATKIAGKGVAKLPGGRDDLLRHGMENTPDTLDKYSSIAEPFQHPTQKREPFRSSNDPAENSASKKTFGTDQGQQKEASIIYEGKSAKPHGSQADGFGQVENSSQMAFAISSNERKESLLEEETMDCRLLKKQRQLERSLQPEQQPEHEQFQPQIQYNGLDFEGDAGEGHVQELNHAIEECGEWDRNVMQDIAAFPVQPHIQGISNGGEFGVSNNASCPESSFWIGSIANRENHPINEEYDLPGGRAENVISIPDDRNDAEAVGESQSIGDQTSLDGKQTAKEEDEPGYLAGASCIKGYTNAWYCQGRLRNSDSPAGSHFIFARDPATLSAK